MSELSGIEAIVAAETAKAEHGEGGETDAAEVEGTEAAESTDEKVEATTDDDTPVVEDKGKGKAADKSVDKGADKGKEKDKAADDKKAETDEEAFNKEHGIEPPKKGKDNRIPHSRVRAIVENSQKAFVKELTGEDVPEGKTVKEALAAYKQEATERGTKVKAQDEELDRISKVEHIMVDSPERFLQMLPYINPKYTDLLRGGIETGTGAKKEEAVPADMPDPDYDLGDGKKTYSPEGLKSLVKWVRDDTTKAVMAELDTRFKPFKDAEESKQYETNVVIPRLQKLVEHARANWPGYKDIEKEVIAEIGKNKNLSLHDGYIKVREVKLTEERTKNKIDRETMKAELMKEINATASSTSTISSNNSRTPEEPAGPHSTEDVVRAALRKAGLK